MARREFRRSLRFCAPEGFCLAQGVTSVAGDRGRLPLSRGDGRRSEGIGTGEYERGALILSRPPAILKVNCPEGVRAGGLGHWVLSHRWERNSPHRAKSCETAAESSRHTKRRKQHSPPALRPQARQGELVRRTKRRPPGGSERNRRKAAALSAETAAKYPGTLLLPSQPSPYRNFFYRASMFISRRK